MWGPNMEAFDYLGQCFPVESPGNRSQATLADLGGTENVQHVAQGPVGETLM